MSAPDALIDAPRLAALSRRLGIPARQLLIAAARLAEHPERAADPEFRASVLREARDRSRSAEASAALLLTPVPDYAIDELDRLFETIWPGSSPQRNA
jgi:hypothetical protein